MIKDRIKELREKNNLSVHRGPYTQVPDCEPSPYLLFITSQVNCFMLLILIILSATNRFKISRSSGV